MLFAVPRIVGYVSHWRESLADPDVKIMRPQQDYRVSSYRLLQPVISFSTLIVWPLSMECGSLLVLTADAHKRREHTVAAVNTC